MTRDELLARLQELRVQVKVDRDAETSHIEADDALLKFIDDPEISKLHEELAPWYA